MSEHWRLAVRIHEPGRERAVHGADNQADLKEFLSVLHKLIDANGILFYEDGSLKSIGMTKET
jgi:hypothetical protein